MPRAVLVLPGVQVVSTVEHRQAPDAVGNTCPVFDLAVLSPTARSDVWKSWQREHGSS
ncbi:hypothetical protein [Frankia gtarii]|uniref:hypothetical protein n=1 Tax=Frankia gtarii TaxID=2950102 RepID=UPI0021C1047C|nr:hypothetical protein [Frankia gtarii]